MRETPESDGDRERERRQTLVKMFNPQVTVANVLTILAVIISLIWSSSSTRSRLDQLELQVQDLKTICMRQDVAETRYKSMDQRLDDMSRSLNRIEDKLATEARH